MSPQHLPLHPGLSLRKALSDHTPEMLTYMQNKLYAFSQLGSTDGTSYGSCRIMLRQEAVRQEDYGLPRRTWSRNPGAFPILR